MLQGKPRHHLTSAPFQAHRDGIQSINDGAILTVLLHVVLIAESCLQFDPISAGHQRKKGIAHVEIQQVASTGVRHQQQTAFVQPPEFLDGTARGAFVLRQNPQLPAGGLLHVIQPLFQSGALGIGERLGQIDPRGGVVRQ